MKLSLKHIASLFLLLSLMYYFWTSSDKPIQTEKAQSESEVFLSEKEIFTLGIQKETATKQRFWETVEIMGETEAPPDAMADVNTRVPGRITRVYFVEGDKIQKGQKLVQIESPEMAKLKSSFLVARSKHRAAEENLKRIQNLVNINLAAKQEYIDAESQFRVLESEKNAAEEALRVNGIPFDGTNSGSFTVFAPRSGIALTRTAIPGSLVQGNHILTTIADLNVLWFQAKIFEKDLSLVSEGKEAEIQLTAFPDLIFPAKVDHIGEKVDPNTRTVHARLVFQNTKRKAKIGLFGKALLRITEKERFLLPESAVVNHLNKQYIFLLSNKNSFRWTEVKTGIRKESKVEILEGISEGDTFVSQGAFRLKAILFKTTFGEE